MKRLLTIAVIAFALLGVSLTIPSLVSTDRLRTAIEQRLTQVFGHPVKLKGGTQLSIRPYLETTYDQVRLGNADAKTPLIDIEEVRIQFNFASLISGNPTIKSIVLVRPKLNLETGADGRQNWRGSIDLGKLIPQASSTSAPANIKIVGGIVYWKNQLSGISDDATSLNGALAFSNSSSAADFSLSGIWNGEAFTAKVGISRIASLLNAGSSQTNIMIDSTPLQLQYDGDLALLPNLALKGRVNARTPSAYSASQWLRRPLPALGLTSELRLEGDVESTSGRFNVQEAQATIGTAIGRGRLQFTTTNSALSVEGTLAFDEVNFPELFELGGMQGDANPNGESLSDGLAVDVRLSANTATSGPLVMEGLAASVFIKDDKTLLDIAQAQALDGQVSGTFRPDTKTFSGFAADLTMTDIDLLQLSQLYGTGNVALEGRGSARFKLESTAPKGERLLQRLNGSARIEGKNGILRGVNLGAVSPLLDDPKKIETNEIFTEQTSYDAIDLNFFIANGVAFFQKTTLASGDITVNLAGRSDLDARSLALQGRVLKAREAGEESAITPTVSLPFMVGGTAGRPLFIALPNSLENAGPPNAIPQIKNSN